MESTKQMANLKNLDKIMEYDIYGGENGNYQIKVFGKSSPCAFVSRNTHGGGYTVSATDGEKTLQIRNLPATATSAQQAAQIMALLSCAMTYLARKES